jgi:hypothetical protein
MMVKCRLSVLQRLLRLEMSENTPIEPDHIETPQIESRHVKRRDYDKKSHGKRYSLAHKLAIKALQSAEVSSKEAAAVLGSSPATVRRLWQDPELDDLSPNVVSKVKMGLGGLFYKRALGASLAITPEKLSQSTALQLATVAGIMTEKGRLMEGLSTENLSFRGVAASIDEDRKKLMDRLKELE